MSSSLPHYLTSPHGNKKLPAHRWYNYNHSYSRELVSRIMTMFSLRKGDRILDPFCGTGTTLLSSRERGIACVGMDVLPLSVFVSNAKIAKYDPTSVRKLIQPLRSMLESHQQIETQGDERVEILSKFFCEKTLGQVMAVSEWCNRRRNIHIKYFFLTALLSVLSSQSNTKKDGGFLRIVHVRKGSPDITAPFLRSVHDMLADLRYLNSLPDVEALAIEGDAREIGFADGSFSAIITSPPYLNRHDYTRVYLLELLVGFLKSQLQLKKLRYYSLCSHVEARRMMRPPSKEYEMPRLVGAALNEIELRPMPNSQVPEMIERYFEDIYLTLRECNRVLRKKGKIAFVLGDSRYSGVKIPVSRIVGAMGEQVGLQLKRKILLRLRGNSPQQMSLYGKDRTEENILIWEKP